MKFRFKIKYTKDIELRFNLSIARYKKPKQVADISKKVDKKIFCIGFGKTGTTSLESALKMFGYKLGVQATAEALCEDWANRKADRIIRFCETADAFQDLPFGLPDLYKELDRAFPNSKFILTVRDNEDQWFNSLVKFHSKLFSSDKGRPPTEHDLMNATYRYKGWALDMKKIIWNYPEIPLYDENYYKQKYSEHNHQVKEYFKNRTDCLLILNVAEEGSYQKLADFLNIRVNEDEQFPWLNKTL